MEISELSAAPALHEALRRFVKTAASSACSMFSDAATRLEISRPTVYAWIADKRLFGWQTTH